MHFIKKIFSRWHIEPINKTKIKLLYGLLGVVMLGNLYQLNQLGYTPNKLFLEMSLPSYNESGLTGKLLENWLFLLTDLKWKNPYSFFTSITPYRHGVYTEQVAQGEIKGYFEQDEHSYLTVDESTYEPISPKKGEKEDLTQFRDPAYVYAHYLSAPGKMEFDLDMLEKWNLYELVNRPISVIPSKDTPKVLIFHTHVREDFIGGATVADVGDALAETLEKKYGLKTLHITESFYEASNQTKFPSNGEYETMEPVIQKVLDENPSISLVIDLHRDGVNENVHLTTEINGKPTAKIMLVNGLCLNRNLIGEVEEKVDLPNPYLSDNLALSLQTITTMNELYPGLSRKIYLNEWRYSTHMRPYSLLMEWGAQTNTSEEALNAVEPVAEILAKVLQKD